MIRHVRILLFVMVVSLVATQALAVESGLAGVRIGESALQLLTKPTFGPPAYIGPIGLSVSREAAAPSPFAAAVPVPTSYSPGAATYRAGTPAGAYSPAATRAAPAYGAPGLGAAPAQPPPLEPVMVWLYRRMPNTLILVELHAEGKVTGVIVDGTSSLAAETARGVRLGASYEAILAAYGYPDQTVNEGQNLILRYLYDGLTFRLSNMRLAAIRLSVNPLSAIPGGGGARVMGTPAAVGVPAPSPAAPAAPAPGVAYPGAPAPGQIWDPGDN